MQYRDRVVIETPSRRFTAADMPEVLAIAGATPMLAWFNQPELYNATWALQSPGVDTFCLYGCNVSTLVAYQYEDDHMRSRPHERMGDGDGGQDLLTNSACLQWASQLPPQHTFQSHAFAGVEHSDMIRAPEVMAVLVKILQSV
jgi:hypothetical protein